MINVQTCDITDCNSRYCRYWESIGAGHAADSGTARRAPKFNMRIGDSREVDGQDLRQDFL